MSNRNFIFDTSTTALPVLLANLMKGTVAEEVGSRNGRTREMTHIGITLLEPWKRELLLFDRKHNLAAQIAETMWVLAGRDDIEFLSHYLPRAADFSDDGKVWRGAYGPRIRGVKDAVVYSTPDQVRFVVDTLRKDPLSRQAVINIYDANRDCGVVSKDIPCNDFIQFTNRLGRLDMHVYIRSNDAIWGWSGINAFEWSALQEIVAGLVGVGVGSLHFSIGSFHVYEYHWAKAREIVDNDHKMLVPEDSPRFEMPLPRKHLAHPLQFFDALVAQWFEIEEAIRTGKDMTERIIEFPEPMLQSWLRVIAWWWTGDYGHLDELPRLAASASLSIQPKPPTIVDEGPTFGTPLELDNNWLEDVHYLHEQKALAYGDSWKKRGEMLGIMANVARKIDRFGKPDIDTEGAADAATDLLVYLSMYRWWMVDQGWAPLPVPADKTWRIPYSDYVVEPVAALMARLNQICPQTPRPLEEIEKGISDRFDELEQMIMVDDKRRVILVDTLLLDAFVLARGRNQK